MYATHSYQPKGTEASRANPCPLCNSEKWCFHLNEDAVVCGKTDHAPLDWVKTGEATDGRGIFAHEGSQKRQRGSLPNPEEILPLALDPKTDSPQWTTLCTIGTESERQVEYLYPDTETGEPLGKVLRKEWSDRRAAYGRSQKETKEIRPWHWQEPYHQNQSGKGWWSDRGKGQRKWPPYKEAEVRDAITSGAADTVFFVAGEQAVEAARSLGLTAFCNQGGEGCYLQDMVNFLRTNKPKLFVIWPDNDDKGVRSSAKLLKACTKAGIPAIVIEPENIWLDMPNKGDIYDVVTKSGMDNSEIIEQLEIEISRALLERQTDLNQEQQKGKKPPKPAAIARELAEKYRHELAWHTGLKLWYRYSAKITGVWSDLPEESVNLLVIAHLESNPVTAGDYSFPFVSHIVNLMKAYLQVPEWHETPGLIPLQDGVLELATGKLLSHAPGYRLLWCLPYSWEGRAIGCQPIQDWMLAAMKGSSTQVEVLRAYLNAVVTGRLDLHRYLECIGPGGTGKGTYTRLAMALVGAENTTVTTLDQLERNRFETAGIFGKRLLMITDSERYGGEVSVLKAITGGDPIRYERKNVQQTKPFMPSCMVILAANEPVQSSDYTSGLERRRLTIPFIHQVKPDERRDLDGEFRPYLPGLLEWVLAMPSDQVTALVRNTSSSVRSLAKWKAESLLETNPMAEWLDFSIVLDPNAKTYVGVAKRDKANDSQYSYLFTDKWLYAGYCEYSTSTGSKPVSGRRFSTLLHDLCVNQLKLEGISKGRDSQGAYFQGLAIRHLDDDRPRPITGDDNPPDEPPNNGGGGSSSPPQPKPSDGLAAGSDGKVTAETRTSDGSDGSDGNFPTQLKSKSEIELQPVKTVSKEPEYQNLPSLLSPTAETQQGQDLQSSSKPPLTNHNSSVIHHDPSPANNVPDAQSVIAPPAAPLIEIRKGQRVKVRSQGSQRDGKIGVVKSVDGLLAVVWLEDSSIRHDLRQWEGPMSLLEVTLE